jgi:hypothetical protein
MAIIDGIYVMARTWQDGPTMTTVHNFHVPLPEDVYSELRQQAQRLHQPATQVARHAIESWLQDRRRDLLHEAIRAYA